VAAIPLEARARVGHSPDPDDAFMFYGIARERVDLRGFVIEQVLEDIESLNRRALAGELEVSAVSIHAYAHLADRYALMTCGASMGDGYGPIVVARDEIGIDELGRSRLAVPGRLTSAFLALRLFLGRDFDHVVVPFDRILDAVADGTAHAGLVIHEGQLTYRDRGLARVVDLGRWWKESTGLPLPLGANAVRRDLGRDRMERLTAVLRDSIEDALAHRDEALAYAMEYGRGLDRPRTDRFVSMYVNDLTRDYGERGRRAVLHFLSEGHRAGLVPDVGRVEFVGPAR
jgi:1,4-dihydroxy-6-naphthoate synthase